MAGAGSNWRRGTLGALCGIIVLVAALLPSAAAASKERNQFGSSQSTPMPTVTGPITAGTQGGPATTISPLTKPLADRKGYVEREYFIAGTARAFSPVGSLGTDGRWTVEPTSAEPYKTRILVRRPPKSKFNGTVYVEWFNVTNGVDLDGSFHIGSEELLKRGYAWVGVSAQDVSVNGQPPGPFTDPAGKGLRAWDPVRYGSLVQPGDSYSYDIFSQAAMALRAGQRGIGPDPLAGLRVGELIGMGVSQSAFRLVTYIDAIHPLDPTLFDGYMVHERGGGGADLSQAPLPAVPVPTPSYIRTDLDVPVMQVQSESDVQVVPYGLGSAVARQPATPKIRTWEIAGASHADLYWYERFAASRTRDYPGFAPTTCDLPFNDGVARPVFKSAIRSLARWADGGRAPTQSPPISTTAGGEVVRDPWGNALGGIRSPLLEAPIARLSTDNGPGFCFLYGSRIPFDQATLESLYPRHGRYVGKFAAATARAVAQGYILPEDGGDLVKQAARAPIP